MQSLWNDAEAADCKTEIAQRVYTSRLFGREPSLVLHGGGNTSVKVTEPDVFGEPTNLLYVKGSGWNLATIDAAGFAPVRMDHLLRLARLPQLSDSQMAQELRIATIRADAPAPSVEAILHAILPCKFVDHCHADALIRVNTVHPNAVFDTGIWTKEVLEQRAASYGISVQEYKTNNILKTEITSRDVGELIAELCGPRFSKTTGAQVPVDGGNERVI